MYHSCHRADIGYVWCFFFSPLEESTHVKTEGHLDVLGPSFTVLLYVTRSHTPEDVMLIQVLFFLKILLPISCSCGLMSLHFLITVRNVLYA